MTQNMKYLLIAAVCAGIGYWLYKKYSVVNKPATK